MAVLFLSACTPDAPPEEPPPPDVYCGAVQWDRVMTYAETGELNQPLARLLSDGCVRFVRKDDTFELTELVTEDGVPGGQTGVCRFTGTVSGFQARITGGGCSFLGSSGEFRLRQPSGRFQVAVGKEAVNEGQALNVEIDALAEDVVKVARPYAQVVEAPQAVTGTARLTYRLTLQPQRTLRATTPSDEVQRSDCPAMDGCWRTALTGTIVSETFPECEELVAQFPATHRLDFKVDKGGQAFFPGRSDPLEAVPGVSSCSVTADEGRAPGHFWSYQMTWSAGGPALAVHTVREFPGTPYPRRCEIRWATSLEPCN
ncbi:hypothetical protein [Archangium violaceum]|uniref:hypothetical protein n=1 Tax=Archangium violaceum TaxID=83451 RepID=UPI0036D9D67F